MRAMADPPLDPEAALPWQKLAAAITDVLRIEPADAPLPGRDAHETRIERIAGLLTQQGLLERAEIERRMERLAARLAADQDRPHPKTRFPNAAPNDIGGMPGGPVDPSPGALADWEKLAVALGTVLGARRILNLHERRRAVEELGDNYNRLGYFERMVAAQGNLLAEKGVLTAAELDRRIAVLRSRS